MSRDTVRELADFMDSNATVTGGRVYFPERKLRELLRSAQDALAQQPAAVDDDMEAQKYQRAWQSGFTAGCEQQVAEIEALRAEVQRLQALTQWQPIATAPKGERVIIYNPLNGRRDIVNGWEDKSIFATHWMPLLEPPVGEK